MAPEAELEPATRRLIPTGRDSTLQQTFPNPCFRFHGFILSFALPGIRACPLPLAPHQFPWAVLPCKFAHHAVLAVVRIDACIQIIGVPNVKPAVRSEERRVGKDNRYNHAASKLK